MASGQSWTFWRKVELFAILFKWTVLCTPRELGLHISMRFGFRILFSKKIMKIFFEVFLPTKNSQLAVLQSIGSKKFNFSNFFEFFQQLCSGRSMKTCNIVNPLDEDLKCILDMVCVQGYIDRTTYELPNPC